MKKLICDSYLKLGCLFVLFLTQQIANSQSFVHPGVMHKKSDLDFVKAKIQANEQPWKGAYDRFLTQKADNYQGITPKPYSSLDYVHHPYANVECGSFNNPNIGCNDMVYDGMAAYSLALRFYFTDDIRYATKAIKIIKDWSTTYRNNLESNSRLVVSWATPWFVNAAEILRHTSGSVWTSANTNETNTLLNRFKTHIFWENRPSNNWMMSSVEARLAIAVFQDDTTAFNDAVSKWKQRIKTYIYQTTDGSTPIPPAGEDAAFVTRIWKDDRNSTAYVNGLCMETCRDINHTKLGFTSLMNGAEIAWSQGVDLFDLEKKRISDFLELHSNWMLGGTVPSNICGGRLDLVSQEAFEIAYNHLGSRLQRNLPKTLQMLNQNRPNSANRWVTKWETLLYANRPFSSSNPTIAVTSVSLTPATLSLAIGGTKQLTATVSPSNATNKSVTYTSSNTAIATVNNTGFVTAIAAGSSTITVKTVNENKTSTCAVTVTPSTAIAVTSVSLTPATLSLAIGGTKQLTATVSPSNATNKSVTYSSSNTAIATVNNSGFVTAISNGSATITVKTADGNKTSTCAVTVATSTSPSGCNFGTPTNTALTSFDRFTFEKMYIYGSSTINVIDFKKFQINWDAASNSVVQFAYSTKSGQPSYYIDLRNKISQNFKSSNPSVTITNSGIAGLDGAYWVTRHNDSFAMVSKTAGYTLYFSNAVAKPSCANTSARLNNATSMIVYPNPASDFLSISKETEEKAVAKIYNLQGSVLIENALEDKDSKIDINKLENGFYIITIEENNNLERKIICIKR